MNDTIKNKLYQAAAMPNMLDEQTLTACENGIDGHEDKLLGGLSALRSLIAEAVALAG